MGSLRHSIINCSRSVSEEELKEIVKGFIDTIQAGGDTDLYMRDNVFSKEHVQKKTPENETNDFVLLRQLAYYKEAASFYSKLVGWIISKCDTFHPYMNAVCNGTLQANMSTYVQIAQFLQAIESHTKQMKGWVIETYKGYDKTVRQDMALLSYNLAVENDAEVRNDEVDCTGSVIDNISVLQKLRNGELQAIIDNLDYVSTHYNIWIYRVHLLSHLNLIDTAWKTLTLDEVINLSVTHPISDAEGGAAVLRVNYNVRQVITGMVNSGGFSSMRNLAGQE